MLTIPAIELQNSLHRRGKTAPTQGNVSQGFREMNWKQLDRIMRKNLTYVDY